MLAAIGIPGAGPSGWPVLGVVLGIGWSALVAMLFVAGVRLAPARAPATGRDGGEARRRTDIRRYLRAIGERFVEDHPVAGHDVAFYLPDRAVAITFDARAFYRIERTATRAVLVEHELPAAHLGPRLPFPTPPARIQDGPDRRDAVAAAFAVLGVAPTASPAALRTAYRRRVKAVHPDQGGDPAAFRRVRDAYATARRVVE